MFNSILFTNIDKQPKELSKSQAQFQDLNLEDLIKSIQDSTHFKIRPFCYQPLTNLGDLEYRQAVFTDLNNPEILKSIDKFTTVMISLEKIRAKIERLDPKVYKQEQLFSLIYHQQQAIDKLVSELTQQKLDSQALQKLLKYLSDYQDQLDTKKLRQNLKIIADDLKKVNYRLEIQGHHVLVQSNPEIRETMTKHFNDIFNVIFENKDQITTPVELESIQGEFGISNLQSSIIQSLPKVYPEQFTNLANFYHDYSNYRVALVDQIVQELEFYLAFVKIEQSLKPLKFVLPYFISHGDEKITNSFDFNLALKAKQIVTNDYCLPAGSRFLVISGPNQGGKTTYARMIGLDYYLASLGVPIPGSKAQIFLKNKLLTHFERQESAEKLTGLLEADVERIHQIVEEADTRSFVIMNELFSSTAEKDAIKLGNEVLSRLMDKSCTGIYITFVEELGKHPQVVPMMSQVDSDTKRTYKIIPQALNNNAYADTLLQKYHLSCQKIEGRI